MPCNCGRTPAVQIRELNQKLAKEKEQKAKKLLMKKKIEEAEKKHLLREESVKINSADVADTTKISTVKVSDEFLIINYSGSVTPEGGKIGLLSGTALNAAGGKDKLSSDPTNPLRSVGYFGVGFGGNITSGGSKVNNWNLSDIDLSAFTHINIAFLAIGSKGNLICPKSRGARGSIGNSNEPEWLKAVPTMDEDGKPDETGLFYQVLDSDNKKGLFGVLKNQIGNSTVKIIPSLGGWGIANSSIYGARLAEMASNTNGDKFKQLIADIKELLKKNYIDGFDIDWEYPGRNPLITNCKVNGESKECTANEPDAIIECPSNNPNCSTFDIKTDNVVQPDRDTGQSTCTYVKTYNAPATTGEDQQNYDKQSVDNYKNFMTQLKNQCITEYPKFELTIAMAGAPWGLHWSAGTIAQLLNTKDANGTNTIIDFANVMAYDYAGFWTNGYMSSFLSNLTTMDTLSNCSVNNSQTPTIIDSPWSGCPGSNGGLKGVSFNLSGKSLKPNGTDIGCPILQYSEFQAVTTKYGPDPASDIGNIEWTTSPASTGVIINSVLTNSDIYDNTIKSHPPTGDPKQGMKWWYNSYISLSTKGFITLLTDKKTFGIDSKKLVLGLPYYGRTFQSENKFQNDSYGLFQKYDYGAPYNYYDIHKHYVVDGKKSDVYTINMTDKGETEDIVYATDPNKILSKTTTKIQEEMVSYNSVDAIKQKVAYAKNDAKLGGYMCWHILSDYFDDTS